MEQHYKLIAALFASVEIEAAEKTAHPNEMKFSGILVRLDEPSTKAPNGSNGHKIMIPKSLAIKTVHTLVGQGVNYSSDLDSHAPTRKVGVIKKAWIEGNAIKVSGIIWKKDFPDAVKDLKQANLGMSFEASDIKVEDPDAPIWKLTHLCFTGAAILYKASAAYYKTEALAASSSKMVVQLIKTKNGGEKMAIVNKKKKTVAASAGGLTPEALVAALTAANKPVIDAINAQSSGFLKLQAAVELNTLETISAKAKKAKADEDDTDDDEDDMDDDMDSEADEDDEETSPIVSKKMKSAKAKKEDDGEDEDDEDASADDEDELEDLDEENDTDENTEPGHVNKIVPSEKKGNKTTVSTKNDHHKSVKASSKLARISAQIDGLIEQSNSDKKKIKSLEKQLTSQNKQLEAAGERVERRSIGSHPLNALLSKEGVDTSTMSAAGEKISVDEMDIMCEKAGIDIIQRVALKSEAAKLGLMDEGHVSRR